MCFIKILALLCPKVLQGPTKSQYSEDVMLYFSCDFPDIDSIKNSKNFEVNDRILTEGTLTFFFLKVSKQQFDLQHRSSWILRTAAITILVSGFG